MITVEAIPYSSFKERIKIVKELMRKQRPDIIEVHKNFVYIQKGEIEYDRGVQRAFK
jgi:hypothetical protein